MFHLTERTLSKLLDGTASDKDVARMLRHAAGCRECARQLEEWRDNFQQLQESYPALAVDRRESTGPRPSGVILMPTVERHRRFEFDLTTALWVGAVGMAVLVGYGVSRLGGSSDELDPTPLVNAPANPADSAPKATPGTVPPRPVGPAPAPGKARPAPAPQSEPDQNLSSPPVSRAAGAPFEAAAPEPTSPASKSKFQFVTPQEAARRIGGPVRTIVGLEPDHIEIGPASGVPGAQPNLSVVRVVYMTADGERMLLDQQRIPADANGFHPIDDPTLESGQTAYGTETNGVNVATWLDDAGYRISLAAKVPVDSLKLLVNLVR